MNTIGEKSPAYGMPTLAGAINKPEKVSMMPPMGDGPMPEGMPHMDGFGQPGAAELKP